MELQEWAESARGFGCVVRSCRDAPRIVRGVAEPVMYRRRVVKPFSYNRRAATA